MKAVNISELKDHLSEYLRKVEGGVTVEVRDRNRPIARIVPIEKKPKKNRLLPAKYPFETIRDKVCPPSDLPFDIVDLLLEDRRER